MRIILLTVLLLAYHGHAVLGTPVWLTTAVDFVGRLFQRGTFISFDDFLKQVQNSTYTDFAGSAVMNETAFDEMKQHILSMYGGVNTTNVTSFFLENEYCDCIQLMQQPSVYMLGLDHIEDPPLLVPPDVYSPNGTEAANISSMITPILDLGLRDQFGNPVTCPEGSVPVQRVTLERLTNFTTLDAFNWKPPVHILPLSNASMPLIPRDLEPRLDPSKPFHLHAFGWETQVNYGLNSFINVWSPAADFSLSQQWVVGNLTGHIFQSVEGGWAVYKPRWGTKSRLFTLYTADDYGKHSCWNHDCGTFTQTNHHWYLGGPFDHYSTYGGQQWGFEMQWQLYQGNWWLFLRGPGTYDPVGYYANKVFLGGQLGRYATDVITGGEVANISSKPAYHHGPMGSGYYAEEGWTHAAFQSNIFRIARNSVPGVNAPNYGVWTRLRMVLQTWTYCYTDIIWQSFQGGSWGTYMYFGGPGGDNCWNGVGS
jgi:hypothetical protein